jgi:hypothetical protein
MTDPPDTGYPVSGGFFAQARVALVVAIISDISMIQ